MHGEPITIELKVDGKCALDTHTKKGIVRVVIAKHLNLTLLFAKQFVKI